MYCEYAFRSEILHEVAGRIKLFFSAPTLTTANCGVNSDRTSALYDLLNYENSFVQRVRDLALIQYTNAFAERFRLLSGE